MDGLGNKILVNDPLGFAGIVGFGRGHYSGLGTFCQVKHKVIGGFGVLAQAFEAGEPGDGEVGFCAVLQGLGRGG
jgi:hypothetical protein